MPIHARNDENVKRATKVAQGMLRSAQNAPPERSLINRLDIVDANKT
ncbi:hypothetical protein SARI_02513 [Salmonella enterica subsp. arizonae serovar 62:z4,z23:-]|uniref:Uncharacterized protein n=1 Tax=Salmonella arizonae (strain ATCC BAA-731 / CDC346-86 / RSK2980) TaxID=41514 RepID=A9MM50_SALAR|nr:hypothetical protein SARI_02513 [Salmonella enterica subsp. arizonae serovar 62:z4,z23:-]